MRTQADYLSERKRKRRLEKMKMFIKKKEKEIKEGLSGDVLFILKSITILPVNF